MRIFFLTILLFSSTISFAQPRQVTLTGELDLNSGEKFPYKVVLTESNGIVKGYSLTFKEPNETKAIISGVLDRRKHTLSFKETQIVYSHGYRTKAFICLLDASMDYVMGKKGRILKGPITNKEADETSCTGGTLDFSHEAELQNLFDMHEKYDTVISMSKKNKEQIAAIKNIMPTGDSKNLSEGPGQPGKVVETAEVNRTKETPITGEKVMGFVEVRKRQEPSTVNRTNETGDNSKAGTTKDSKNVAAVTKNGLPAGGNSSYRESPNNKTSNGSNNASNTSGSNGNTSNTAVNNSGSSNTLRSNNNTSNTTAYKGTTSNTSRSNGNSSNTSTSGGGTSNESRPKSNTSNTTAYNNGASNSSRPNNNSSNSSASGGSTSLDDNRNGSNAIDFNNNSSNVLDYNTSVATKSRPNSSISLANEVNQQMQAGMEKITAGVEKTYNWHNDTLRIDLWDGGNIDGDRVTLLFNGMIYLNNYFLVKEKRHLEIPLSADQINTIIIIAENEGTDPPTTASLYLWDGQKRYALLCYNAKGQQGVIKLKRW